MKTNGSDDWTIQKLDIVLKGIKKGKSKDPEGLSREIFHLSLIERKLKKSITHNVQPTETTR